MARAEVGGTSDFVDVITPDPFMYAYNKKQFDSKSSRGESQETSKSDLRQAWLNQIQDKALLAQNSRQQNL